MFIDLKGVQPPLWVDGSGEGGFPASEREKVAVGCGGGWKYGLSSGRARRREEIRAVLGRNEAVAGAAVKPTTEKTVVEARSVGCFSEGSIGMGWVAAAGARGKTSSLVAAGRRLCGPAGASL